MKFEIQNLTWDMHKNVICSPHDIAKKKKNAHLVSTTIVIFSYPKLLSFSVLTFIKWRLNTELLANTQRNVVFSI
jgi:hypothetical protein